MSSNRTAVTSCQLTVYPGWDEAVLDMRVGERATLDITSDYGYGEKYARLLVTLPTYTAISHRQ